MKILFFVKQGRVEKDHMEYQWERIKHGDVVHFANGSFNKGFEDSCDLIVMDCENKHIEAWASKKGYEIISFGEKPKEVVEKVVEDVVDTTDTVTVEDIIGHQLEKADAEFDIPKSVEAGLYVSKDGTEYEHKGKAFKKEFKNAIAEHGFESFTKK